MGDNESRSMNGKVGLGKVEEYIGGTGKGRAFGKRHESK